MSSGSPTGSDTGPADDAEKLRQEIRHTRERMGETVEQLAARADVKARARVKAADVAGQVKGAASMPLAVVAGVLVVGSLAIRWWRRRRP